MKITICTFVFADNIQKMEEEKETTIYCKPSIQTGLG